MFLIVGAAVTGLAVLFLLTRKNVLDTASKTASGYFEVQKEGIRSVPGILKGAAEAGKTFGPMAAGLPPGVMG